VRGPDLEMVQAAGPAQGDGTPAVGDVVAEAEVARGAAFCRNGARERELRREPGHVQRRWSLRMALPERGPQPRQDLLAVRADEPLLVGDGTMEHEVREPQIDVLVAPWLEVIADDDGVESALLGEHGIVEELARPELLGGRLSSRG